MYVLRHDGTLVQLVKQCESMGTDSCETVDGSHTKQVMSSEGRRGLALAIFKIGRTGQAVAWSDSASDETWVSVLNELPSFVCRVGHDPLSSLGS